MFLSIMKQFLLFSLFILNLFFSGCTTTNKNPNHSIWQTYTENPISRTECQVKQCCLKDSFNVIIKQDDKICKIEEKLDSACLNLLDKSIVNSVKNKNDNRVKNDIRNKVINQTNSNCSNNSCGESNIFIKNIINTENGKSKKNRDWDEILELLKENGWCNLLLLTLIYLFPLLLGIIAKIYLFLLSSVIQTILIADRIFDISNNKVKSYIEKHFEKLYEFISNLVLSLKKYASKIINIIQDILGKNTYETLSPTDNADVSSETLKQLKFSIIDENDKIKNIAITGPYGSGKSSVWLTFKKKYFLSILKNVVELSLASFCEKQENKIIYASTETEIEQAIIQQLIFSKKKNSLKYSFFPKINNLTYLKTSFYTTLALIFASIILFCTNNTLFNFIISWILAPSLLGTFYIILALLIVYNITFTLFQKINKMRISKICVKEVELTLGENSSYFNKYINEIVYFFEATKCNCVVFEDLDRLNTPKIFVKLRELNILLNNYPAIKGKIKFIYLIKDDVLAKYERTKFFDYIIPVIPTLSVNNSASIFRSELNNLSDKIFLEDDYLISIQDYLKDFRLLKNCINEFYIYKDEIENIRRELLDYEIDTFLNHQDSTYIDKLINKKLFSIILYKNLFPKDFSNLENNEGVLFDCLNLIDEDFLKQIDDAPSKLNDEILSEFINKKRETTRDLVSQKSIKETLKSNNNSKSRNKFKKIVNALNTCWKYKGKECVDPDLLLIMLNKGYIENDYEMYVKKYNDSILNYKEQIFLLNVKNDFPASKDLELRKNKIELICKNIQSYQWNSPGIINEKIVDYIIQSKDASNNKKIEGIIEAMYAYDSTQPQKFIPQYFEHCQIENVDTEPLLEKIEIVLEKNKEDKCIKLLGYFFNNTDINFFVKFLETIDSDLVIYDISSTIGKFIDSSEESFKKKLNQYSDFSSLISIMENQRIKIALTPEICKNLVKNNKLSAKIFKITKDNIDIILKEFNLTTDEQNYLTRCLSINDLKELILNNYTFPFFNRILSGFNDVDEDYSAIKTFFEANKKTKFNISNEKKQPYFIKLPSKWEKFVIYNHFISFDDYLSESIKKFMVSSDSNQEISDSLKNDEFGIKEFIRAVIKKSDITNDILFQSFFPFWGNYVFIPSCYDGENQEIQEMDPERNHLLQNYIIDKVKNKTNSLKKDFSDIIKESSNTIINLIIKDLDYFERTYFVSNFSEETELEKVILETDVEKADSIKGLFIKNFSPNSKIEENERKFKLYKKAGLQIKNSSSSAIVFLNTLKNQLNGVINNIKVIDLLRFSRVDINVIMDRFKKICDTIVFTNDSWSILLYQNFTFWANKFVIFMEDNTTDIGYPNWGLKEPDRNDEKIVKERKNAYREIVQKLEFWAKELDEYIKVFN